MGVGLGKQNLTIKPWEQASTSLFNKQFSKFIKPGIYWGADITIVADDTVEIGLFRLLVECTTGEIVRVETEEAVVQIVDESTPYLTYNLTWNIDPNNSGTFDTKDAGSLFSNDIVFGKCNFVGGIIDSIDYSEKTWGLFDENYNIHLGGGIAIEGVKDEDDMISDSDTCLITQQSAKAYVDSHTSLSSGVHGVTGSLVGEDSTQTLNNKTYNNPVLDGDITGSGISDDPTLAGGSHTKLVTEYAVKIFASTGGASDAFTLQGMEPIDEDTMVSNSDVHLPTQQSVKAYSDAHKNSTSTHGVIGNIVGTNSTQSLTNKTLVDPVLNGNLSGTGILNENDLASNSSLQVPTQSSVKFYIDQHKNASVAHGVTSDLVGRTDVQTLTQKTLASPILNTNITGTGVLDEDNLDSNSSTKLVTQRAVKYYVDKYRDLGDIKFNYDLITISASQPWYNLSKADAILDVANYPDFVPYLRAIMLRYDPLNTNVTNFSVTDWVTTGTLATITFANATPENTLLLNLVEDQLVHGSFTNWRSISLPLPIGNILAGDYEITGINLTNRTISFACTELAGSGAVTSNVNFYTHRIVGSTATARMFKTSGRGFFTAGNNGDVEYIAGLRLRDSFKSHRHTVEADNNTNTATIPLTDPDASGAVGIGRDAQFSASNDTQQEPTVQTALTGSDETRPKTYNAFAYIYVGTYIA